MALRDPVAMLVLPDRARWTPESAEGAVLLRQLPDGTHQYLMQRLRIEVRPDGSLRRAPDLLPASRTPVSSLPLPDRLGGGFLFVTSGSSSSLWRSTTFLGRLASLVRLPVSGVQVVAGTDRLLVRMLSGDRVWGVDPETGAVGAALPLPVAPRYGGIAFVDARQGAVYADLLGLMVTRDAGVSWRSVPLHEPPKALVAEELSEGVVVQVGSRKLRVDPATGTLSEDGPALTPTGQVASSARETSNRRPWGVTAPLRVAIEEGWPLLDGTAVVFRAGRVVRVKLEDGSVLSSFSPVEAEEAASCLPVRFGADVGFVCGAPGQGTKLYVYEPPGGVALVLSFAAPRRIVPSQNGWLVVHGSCDSDAPGGAEEGVGKYCILSPVGGRREVLTRGDVGVERVVALSDGRVAVVVPPRGSSDGVVTLLPAESNGTTRTMSVQPGEDAALLRRGLWLDGMYEVVPGEVGGWIEGGGRLVGVRIRLAEGSVQVGAPQEGLFLSVVGPAAMVAQGSEALAESLDGGFSWKPVEMPPALGQGKLGSGLRCGVAGCVVPFERGTWLRVGWGKPADPTDLEDAQEGNVTFSSRTIPRPLRLTCSLGVQETLKESEVLPPPRRRFVVAVPPAEEAPPGPLPSFLGVPPPSIPEGALALSEGTASGTAARIYGWVPRGVAAGRAGRLLVRFEDRFAPERPVRSSKITVASWQDEQALRDAMGQGGVGVAFHGLGDPGGKAMLLSACQGVQCSLFSVVDGRPVTPVAPPDDDGFGRLVAPSASALWHDEAFFLAVNAGPRVDVWKVEAGQPRRLAKIPRVTTFNNQSAPVTLVRRARGGLIGLLTRGASSAQSEQDLFLLPIDPTTGKTGDMLRLGASDLSWVAPRVCSPEEDGWLIDLQPMTYPVMTLPPGVRLGEVELRARVEPSSICLEAGAARLLDSATIGKQASAPTPPVAGSIPLLATSPNKRVTLYCRP
ncbi:MAG: hypothetical protein RMJ98_12940 [Myxococcales bacterium]|nr:hypothetical protein [Myxococcales bacterium]